MVHNFHSANMLTKCWAAFKLKETDARKLEKNISSFCCCDDEKKINLEGGPEKKSELWAEKLCAIGQPDELDE